MCRSLPASFLRRRRPPRRPRRRERVASSLAASACCDIAGTGAVNRSTDAGVAVADGAFAGAPTGAGSRLGRSAAGCWAGCGLRCCGGWGFWRCASGRGVSCCGRGSRRCCCLLPPSRGRSRGPRASRCLSSRRGCWPLPRADFPRAAAGTSSASVFSGAAGLWNQLSMRAKNPGVGARVGVAVGSGVSRTGAGLAGTMPLTAGFSGSAPGLAICGGGATTAGVRRS